MRSITAIRLVLTVFAEEYEQQHRDGAPGRTLPGLLSPSGFSTWINHRGNGAGVPSDHLASGMMKMSNG
jgi:hypothetical protein